MFRHRAVLVFCMVQLVGIACSWFWDHPPSSASSFLWGTAFVLLFPGNIAGAVIIEKLFWQRMSLGTMGVVTTVVLVAVNAFIWFVATATIRMARARGTTGGSPLNGGGEPDPRRAVLTRLIWLWSRIAFGFCLLAALGEWVTVRAPASTWPAWALMILNYFVYGSVALAIGFSLIAIITARQRSTLGR
jgi:hypothetical protein